MVWKLLIIRICALQGINANKNVRYSTKMDHTKT